MLRHPDDNVVRLIRESRAELLTLRSEDERQRYVEDFLRDFKDLSGRRTPIPNDRVLP